MKRFATTIKTAMILPLFFMGAMSTAYGELRDYELKAVLIYKLTKFVTWPQNNEASFDICVYGQNPFGDALKLLDGKQVNSVPIKTRHLSSVFYELDNCQLLFIANSASGHLNRILLATSYSPVLTVSDIENFAKFGGMIEMTSENQQVGFSINVKAAKAVDLNIASPLLELSEIVGGS